MQPAEIIKLTQADPISQVELMTGKSYKEDEVTSLLGMCMSVSHGAYLDKILSEANDTKHRNTVEEYIRIISGIGFQQVYKEIFYSSSSRKDEAFYIWFHYEYGILLKFDTFWGQESVNGGHFYYNYSPDDEFMNVSSGRFWANNNNLRFLNEDLVTEYISEFPEHPKMNDDDEWEKYLQRYETFIEDTSKIYNTLTTAGKRKVWVGDHDCRVALVSNIKMMLQNGKFIPNWVERPFMYLIHHGQSVGTNEYKNVNLQIINQLPEQVRKQITPTLSES